MKVEVDVLGYPPLIVRTRSVCGRKVTLKQTTTTKKKKKKKKQRNKKGESLVSLTPPVLYMKEHVMFVWGAGEWVGGWGWGGVEGA